MNAVFLGTNGVGKTHYVGYNNLMQADRCYIVHDPNGDLYRRTGEYLRSKGYRVYRYMADNPADSLGYDPIQLISLLYNANPDKCEDFCREFLIAAMGLDEQDERLYGLLSMFMVYINYLCEYGPIRRDPAKCGHFTIYDLMELMDDIPYSMIYAHVPPTSSTYKSCEAVADKSIEAEVEIRTQLVNLCQLFEERKSGDRSMSFGLLHPDVGPFVLYVSAPIRNNCVHPILNALFTQLIGFYEYCFQKDGKAEFSGEIQFIIDDLQVLRIPNLHKHLRWSERYQMYFLLMARSIEQIQQLYPNTWEKLLNECQYLISMGRPGDDVTADILQKIEKKLEVQVDWEHIQKKHVVIYKKQTGVLIDTIVIKDNEREGCV